MQPRQLQSLKVMVLVYISLEELSLALDLSSKEVWLCVMVMASAEYIHYSGLGLNYTGSFIYLETYGYPYVYPHNYDEVMLLSL